MLFALFPILLANAQTADVPIVHVLTIGRTGLGGRRSLPTDAIQAKFNMNPKFEVKENEPELMLDGTMRKWTPLDAGSDGVFRNQDLQGGWAYAEVTSQKAQIMMLEASGHSMVYVNGCPRAGDPYSFGTLKLPVQLESGVNRFLFAAGRGTLKAKLTPIVKPISLNLADPTLPDFVIGRKQTNFAAVVVSNATPQFVRDLILVAEVSGVKHVSRLDAIPPIGIRKVGFQISIPAISKEGTAKCSLHLMRANTEIDAAEIELHIRRPEGTQKRTFVSEIDGSVQYFGIVPCADASNNSGALVLTCHGASVEAIGQADAYSSKSWATIVAPTNRRPYGFDWEDWGRMDAMEVLKIAKQTIPHDNQRVYLTGHSMGGHGTYQLGALYPGEFAAIGPSAAWASFDSYTGSRFVRDPSPAQAMMERACAPSRTELLIQNYADLGVYILHGDADDNVPVREARNMKSALDAFHKDVRLFEQPGAGHWWENSDEPGAECMDWPPMYDFFARHRKAAVNEVRHVLFLTACPGISAKKDWVEILTQEAPLKISKVDMSLDPKQRRFTGTTENVERLRLLLGGVQGDGEISIKIDGSELKVPRQSSANAITLEHSSAGWRKTEEPSALDKNPDRGGLFKQAFTNRFVFVYATHGSSDENEWSLNKAKFDAETFYYRGNGSVEIVSDDEFLKHFESSGRNAVFFGNEHINSAWRAVSPNNFGMSMENAGCLFTRPGANAKVSYAFVGGSNLVCMRGCDRIPYFVSGTAYPDYLTFDAGLWSQGVAAVRTVGFFGTNWSIETGDWVRR